MLATTIDGGGLVKITQKSAMLKVGKQTVLKAYSDKLRLTHAAGVDSCVSADIEYFLIFCTTTFHHSLMRQTQFVWMTLELGRSNVTKIKVGYSQVLAQCAHSMENWFFPSSEVTRVLKMELFQLKNFECARVHDITWWEEFERTHWVKTREYPTFILVTLI